MCACVHVCVRACVRVCVCVCVCACVCVLGGRSYRIYLFQKFLFKNGHSRWDKDFLLPFFLASGTVSLWPDGSSWNTEWRGWGGSWQIWSAFLVIAWECKSKSGSCFCSVILLAWLMICASLFVSLRGFHTRAQCCMWGQSQLVICRPWTGCVDWC